eukprot:1156166-Pelagomonas_calceolata.AAC.1
MRRHPGHSRGHPERQGQGWQGWQQCLLHGQAGGAQWQGPRWQVGGDKLEVPSSTGCSGRCASMATLAPIL